MRRLVKILLVLALATLVSCADERQGPGNPVERLERLVGDSRRLRPEERLSAYEAEILWRICSDLKRKGETLADFAEAGTRIRYRASDRACGEEEVGERDIELSVGLESERLTYVASDGVEPPFKYPVTHKDGLMGEACASVDTARLIGELPPRILRSESDPVWVTVYKARSARCAGEPYGNCVYFETGLRQAQTSTNYLIRDAQVIIVDSKKDEMTWGFTIERSQLTSCLDEDKSKRRLLSTRFLGFEF